MLEDGFGIDFSVTTTLGTYYVKFGGWSGTQVTRKQSLAFFLPLNMELVVLVNSPVAGEQIADGTPQGNLLYPLVQSAYMNHIVWCLPMPLPRRPDGASAALARSRACGYTHAGEVSGADFTGAERRLASGSPQARQPAVLLSPG